MLKLFNQVNAGVEMDFISLDGDLISHGVAMDTDAP